MKINLDLTFEVSDEQRVKLANLLDGKLSKRPASRAEIKAYVWEHGSAWEQDLLDSHFEMFPNAASPADPVAPAIEIDEEDLL